MDYYKYDMRKMKKARKYIARSLIAIYWSLVLLSFLFVGWRAAALFLGFGGIIYFVMWLGSMDLPKE